MHEKVYFLCVFWDDDEEKIETLATSKNTFCELWMGV